MDLEDVFPAQSTIIVFAQVGEKRGLSTNGGRRKGLSFKDGVAPETGLSPKQMYWIFHV